MYTRWSTFPFQVSGSSFVALSLIASFFAGGSKNGNLAGKLPSCDAGAPQTVECTGPITAIQLDGTGSSNPVQGALTYHWEFCNDPLVTMDDPSSPTPTLFVELQENCTFSCTVYLSVRNQYGATSCSTIVTVNDTTAPALTCPPDITVKEGDPTDPDATGWATATDACHPNPKIAWVDDLSQGPNKILRLWMATDGCQTSTCTQTITIEPPPPHFDLRPGVCPNKIVVSGPSLALVVSFPTALIGNDFDVTQVDLSTVNLNRAPFLVGGTGGVKPIEFGFVDISAPFEGEECGCEELQPDGILDLAMFFDVTQLVNELQLDQEPDGTVLTLQLNGLYLSGQEFGGQDCVTIVNPDQ